VATVLGADLMLFDDLRSLSLFDGLTDAQLAELAEGGAEVWFEPGVVLFHEGEHADYWWVHIEGAIDLLRRAGPEETVIRTMNVPGWWAGGFRAFDEHGVYLATGRGATYGRIFRVPAEVLRDRLNAWFPLGRHLIEGLYGTARSIESTARQREALVTLGKLAAGLAHEINNPAAATTRALTSWRPRARRCSHPSPGSPIRRSRPGSSPRSTRCAVRSSLRQRTRARWTWPTRRTPCRRG
jgi:CRP-like cAMP-binding protein